MKTRDRIVEIAITLFNEHGTGKTSTNHIARAAGISPGNLYYHFKNKEEIIRSSLDLMNRVGQDEFDRIQKKCPPGSREGLTETFLMIQKFNWRFRFFKRELTALVLADPKLKEKFVRVNRIHLDLTRKSLQASIQAGNVRRLDDRSLSLLSEEIWLVNLFWLNYLEIGGEDVDEATLKRGIEVLENIIARYVNSSA